MSLMQENNRIAFTCLAYISYLKFLPLILVFVAIPKQWLLYGIFISVTAIIIYYTKLYHLPVDVSPLFFLEITITKYYGLKHTLFYIFLAYIVPKTFAGSNMKFDSYVFIFISLIAV